MEKLNQKIIEREFEKALAIEYARNYCVKNNLSLEKLKKQRFTLVNNECVFEEPINIELQDMVIDGDPKPQITLIIKYEKGQLQIMETEFTKKYLGV